MSDLESAIAAAKERLEALEDQVGPITHRKMFGGAGLYARGAIFAVIVEGELMLKADPKTAPDLAKAFEAAGAERWRYAGKSKPVAMPYWRLPEAALDDPEETCAWARRSIAAL
ncbi:MAG: TfoX/Sxy family protein [Pseudomonadota bacterium]